MDKHTKAWLSKQPLWTDRDMFVAIVGSMILGSIIAKIFT